jgi:sugar O-acyltransferase (sialic acid O-acetyltransferase NeuD family)
VNRFDDAAGSHRLLIIGAGGLGAIAASLVDDINMLAMQNDRVPPWEIIGYADGDPAKHGNQHAGRAVRGSIDEIARTAPGSELCFFCAIGDNAARARTVERAESVGWKPATLVHPSAVLATNVELGPGTYIGPLSVIAANSKVGAHAIVDAHVSIGHDVLLKDFCSVFPGARISGFCSIEEYALVGSNATLLPGTRVGERAIVGAASLAHGLIEPDTTVFGVPGRVIPRTRDRYFANSFH